MVLLDIQGVCAQSHMMSHRGVVALGACCKGGYICAEFWGLSACASLSGNELSDSSFLSNERICRAQDRQFCASSLDYCIAVLGHESKVSACTSEMTLLLRAVAACMQAGMS